MKSPLHTRGSLQRRSGEGTSGEIEIEIERERERAGEPGRGERERERDSEAHRKPNKALQSWRVGGCSDAPSTLNPD